MCNRRTMSHYSKSKEDAVRELNCARDFLARGNSTQAAFYLGRAVHILEELSLALNDIGLDRIKYDKFLQTMSEDTLKALLAEQTQ